MVAILNFVKYYLRHLKNSNPASPIFKANIALINKARHQLYSPTNASNLYALIRTRGMDELGLRTVSQLLNDYGLELIDSSKKLPKFLHLRWLAKLCEAKDRICGAKCK